MKFYMNLNPKTSGWQSWQDTDEITTLKAGDYKLNFNVLEGAFNVNWFDFVYNENGGIQIPGNYKLKITGMKVVLIEN